jgi:predicted ABC-type ATPase
VKDVLKEIVILGGPNGAGKTTAAPVLPPEFLDLHSLKSVRAWLCLCIIQSVG